MNNGFMYRISNAIRRFFLGRRGIDEYGKFLVILSLVLIILSRVINNSIAYFFNLGGWIALIWFYARATSRNIAKRQQENLNYLQYKNKITKKFNFARSKTQYNSNTGIYYKYFECPYCGQMCRVPKNKGKIRITCPTCGKSFEKRS